MGEHEPIEMRSDLNLAFGFTWLERSPRFLVRYTPRTRRFASNFRPYPIAALLKVWLSRWMWTVRSHHAADFARYFFAHAYRSLISSGLRMGLLRMPRKR